MSIARRSFCGVKMKIMCMIKELASYSLIPRPFHVFQQLVTWCMAEWVEICNCASNRIQLHHQIDQTFLTFLTYIEKHEKAWVQG